MLKLLISTLIFSTSSVSLTFTAPENPPEPEPIPIEEAYRSVDNPNILFTDSGVIPVALRDVDTPAIEHVSVNAPGAENHCTLTLPEEQFFSIYAHQPLEMRCIYHAN